MNAKGHSRSQHDAIAELARKYLGPFSDEAERTHWEWVVRELVLTDAKIVAQPISLREDVRLLRQLVRTGKRFRRELRNLNGPLKYGLKSMGIIETENIADALQKYLTEVREFCSFVEETPGFKERRGRGQAWLTLKKEGLLKDAQGALEERGRPHGLTRNGHLAHFAAEIWNCANGTTVSVDAFSHPIDHLQKVRRDQKAYMASTLAGSKPRRHPAPPQTRTKNRSDTSSKRAV